MAFARAFGGARAGGSVRKTRAPVRALDVGAALAALAAAILTVLGLLAPVPGVAIDPAAVSSDGESAYVATPEFGVPWPYVVPSHPDFDLRPGDVRVTENGAVIGALQPSHALIRAEGGGAFNLWKGGLWFSASDGTDPRTNGRSYRVEARARLSPKLVALRDWSFAALGALLLARLGLLALPGIVRGAQVVGRGAASSARSAESVVRTAAASARRVAAHVPLTFGRLYALVGSTALGALVWGTFARPAQFFTQPDSFGYLVPGLVWASGADMTGQSIRDIGYPLLTLLAVKLGTLAVLPRLQLVIVAAGIACLLGALYLPLPAVTARLNRVAAVPRWLCATAAALLAAAFVTLLANHDLFVIDIESAMAEGPHVLPTAAAALLFVGAWIATSSPRRIVLLTGASLAAYASAVVKPHTLFVVLLCLASLVLCVLRSPRALRSPPVIAIGLCAAFLALGINRLEAWVTPRGTDFGPRILFCNHLDVIEPVFARSNPERVRVAAMMLDTLSRVDGWPLMGYAGDGCIYNDAFTAAITAAAQAEGESTARWETREFLLGVVRNPLRYARDALHQTSYFMLHPIANIDLTAHSDLNDADEAVLRPYAALINMPRGAWDAEASNWVPAAYPQLGGRAKGALQAISALFAPVTLLATAIAAAVVAARRTRLDLRPEIAIVATACFTAFFAATVILTHSFDVGRYVTDLLPISLLWWFLSAVYLAHAVILAFAWVLRRQLGTPRRAAPQSSVTP